MRSSHAGLALPRRSWIGKFFAKRSASRINPGPDGLSLARGARPVIPSGMRIYAIGDIHGCAALLDKMHKAIEADAANFAGEKQIVYLGDYIDRGPDSKGVIRRLIEEVPEGFAPFYLKGNHDAALLQFLDDPSIYRSWRNYGAPQTLLSYGVRPPLYDSPEKYEEARNELLESLPQSHLEFLRSLELTRVVEGYLFVHAGLRPGRSIAEQTEYDLLWIRDEFHSSIEAFEKFVVHGHTPVREPQRLLNRIAVDTGAYATSLLSCVVLENDTWRFIKVGAKATMSDGSPKGVEE